MVLEVFLHPSPVLIFRRYLLKFWIGHWLCYLRFFISPTPPGQGRVSTLRQYMHLILLSFHLCLFCHTEDTFYEVIVHSWMWRIIIMFPLFYTIRGNNKSQVIALYAAVSKLYLLFLLTYSKFVQCCQISFRRISEESKEKYCHILREIMQHLPHKQLVTHSVSMMGDSFYLVVTKQW
jgi:hypothetical protein